MRSLLVPGASRHVGSSLPNRTQGSRSACPYCDRAIAHVKVSASRFAVVLVGSVQHLAHLLAERANPEGLLQQERPWFEDAVSAERLVRVSRHIEDPRPGPEALQPPAQLPAAHLGHHHVREQKVNRPGISIAEREGGGRAGGREHRVARRAQHLRDEFQIGRASCRERV